MALNELTARAASLFGADVPTAQSILRIAVSLAQDAARLPGLAGRERLELVLTALRETLRDQAVKKSIPPATLSALTEVINTVVPETITLVVSASRGEFALKKPSVGCLMGLCSSIASVAAQSATASEVRPPVPATPTQTKL
jgi:hypothetical protein